MVELHDLRLSCFLESTRPSDPLAPTSRRRQFSPGSLPDEIPFELRYGFQDVEEEPPRGGRRVDCLVQDDEIDAGLLELPRDRCQLVQRPGETVELDASHDVEEAASRIEPELRQCWPERVSSGGSLVQVLGDNLDPAGPCEGAKGVELDVQVETRQ